MEVTACIAERRSIRQYDTRQVDRSLLEQLIEAALLAPTWKNSQTGRYHIVEDQEILKRIREEALPPFNAENCKHAPVLIICSFLPNRSGFERDGTPSNELGNGWGCYDVGLQNENLLLKATDLGLSSLVMGIRDAEKIKELLAIPQEEVIVSVISIGYGAQQPSMPKRKAVCDVARFY